MEGVCFPPQSSFAPFPEVGDSPSPMAALSPLHEKPSPALTGSSRLTVAGLRTLSTEAFSINVLNI